MAAPIWLARPRGRYTQRGRTAVLKSRGKVTQDLEAGGERLGVLMPYEDRCARGQLAELVGADEELEFIPLPESL